jgi:SAM-dependent methyltransferase
MDEYTRANQAHWDELVAVHARSAFYDLAGFRAGRLSLMPLERQELGQVADRSLLHLQCHFGMDTLSWARLGAQVTGADYSEQAIALARSLSAELDIPAHFVCSDLYQLPQVLSGQFDIVFTSYGVLAWLPDLPRWGQIVAHFLKPGGIFYMAEIHPFAGVFGDEAQDAGDLRPHYSYFHSPEPMEFEIQGSYADPDAQLTGPVVYEWFHGLGDVVNALVAAGLRIDFVREFPFCCFRMFPFMERDEDGWWRLAGRDGLIPMTFSLQASRTT